VITLCKIVFEKDGCYLCQKERMRYDPKILIKDGLFPYPFRPTDVARFRIENQSVDGFLLAKNEQSYYAFMGNYSQACIKDDDSTRVSPGSGLGNLHKLKLQPKNDPHILAESVETKILEDNQTGSKLLFLRDSMVGFTWKETEGNIIPRLLGNYRPHSLYFFYGAYSDESHKMVLRSTDKVEEIPESILEDFGEDADVQLFGSNEEWGSRRWHVKKDAESLDECYADFLPFPPFEVVTAIKLLEPETVARSKPVEVPSYLKHPFFLKTCLIPPEPVPIQQASYSELKAFSQCIQKNLYYPNIKTEDPHQEYRNLFKNSAGYVLLCRPKFPIRRQVP